MSRSSIEWTDRVWNPVTGCSEVSPGCGNCYARKQSERLKRMGSPKYSRGFEVVEHESALDLPITWNRPSRVFVNSMSDLFHDEVSDEFIERVFAVMALCGHHAFQILTKRPERMRRYVLDVGLGKAGGEIQRVADSTYKISGSPLDRVEDFIIPWPLPNVWLGVSVEDQRRADERIPVLLDTPAAVRWISAEPLLGPISLSKWVFDRRQEVRHLINGPAQLNRDQAEALVPRPLDWVVAGGESGPGSRPMDAAWVRSLRAECADARTAFFFKQWGSWRRAHDVAGCWSNTTGFSRKGRRTTPFRGRLSNGAEPLFGGRSFRSQSDDRGDIYVRLGKKLAGRELDGRTWDQMPALPARSGGRG